MKLELFKHYMNLFEPYLGIKEFHVTVPLMPYSRWMCAWREHSVKDSGEKKQGVINLLCYNAVCRTARVTSCVFIICVHKKIKAKYALFKTKI